MDQPRTLSNPSGEPTNTFDLELIVSPIPILASLLVVPVFASLYAWRSDQPDQMMNMAVGMFAAIAICWTLLRVWPRIAVAATLAIPLGMAIYLRLGFNLEGVLVLACLPVVLAGALTSLPGLLTTTGVAGALVLALPLLTKSSISVFEQFVALAAIGLSALAIGLRDRAATSLGTWAYDHYAAGQERLAEARQRQSKLKQAIDALAHANRQLELSNERTAIMRRIAEEAQRTKAAFVSNVSHEFRTPLNIIIGLAEVLADGADVYGQELPEGARHDIAILYRNTEHLSRMVNDVLDLGQVEAGRLPLHREWCDLGDLVDHALSAMIPLVERRSLYLRVEVEPDLPQVYCDVVRIRQVLLNLVSNGIRYSDTGGVTVRVERHRQRAVVSVKDTGPGIAPRDIRRIFEPFQQALDQHTREGSGLGLAISRELVEMHQGRMWVESSPGEGSTFFFSLAIGQVPGHLEPTRRWLTEGWVARDVNAMPGVDARPKLLIAETGDDLFPTLERYSDAVCAQAANLQEALQDHAREPAQVVLVNSYDLADVAPRVRRYSDAMPDVPVIGFCVPPRSEQGLNLDVLDYLLKPVHSADLERVLAMVPDVSRVLIVDDDEDTRWVLQRNVRSLCGEDIIIDLAKDGASALDQIEKWLPDLVLLDVILPDMDGWQVLAAKRDIPGAADTPIVMVSAQNLVEDPLTSRLVVATMGEGLTWSKMLQLARNLSTMLVEPG